MASAKKDDDQPSAQTSAFTAGDGWRSDLTGGLLSPEEEAPARLLPGAKLGHYVLVEKIGEGGMGLVFKATDTSLERTVALKVMFCGPHDDQRQAQRFEREARQMARLSHPNLLHVYSVGSDAGCHFFAMELLRGETLLNAIRRLNGIPAPDLMQYAVQIVSALYYVHQKGITHRDIKSGNIMLCGRRAVLMDFGLAKDETDSGLTTVGAIMGTPDYMPPEAAEGRSAGAATDIYSLGVVLYEALSGQLPFVGKSAISIIRQHIDTPPPDLQMLVPEIKPELAAIVHKCLEKILTTAFRTAPNWRERCGTFILTRSCSTLLKGVSPAAMKCRWSTPISDRSRDHRGPVARRSPVRRHLARRPARVPRFNRRAPPMRAPAGPTAIESVRTSARR